MKTSQFLRVALAFNAALLAAMLSFRYVTLPLGQIVLDEFGVGYMAIAQVVRLSLYVFPCLALLVTWKQAGLILPNKT